MNSNKFDSLFVESDVFVYTAKREQTAVTVYFRSKRLQLYAFSQQCACDSLVLLAFYTTVTNQKQPILLCKVTRYCLLAVYSRIAVLTYFFLICYVYWLRYFYYPGYVSFLQLEDNSEPSNTNIWEKLYIDCHCVLVLAASKSDVMYFN